MSVLSKISVGDILFYTVDDKPTHVSPKGSISILNGSGLNSSLFYRNNDGGNTWVKLIGKAYANMFIDNNTTLIDPNTLTEGGWYSFNSTSGAYTLNTNDGFTKVSDETFGDSLEYTGTTNIRALISASSTFRAGNNKWIHFEVCPAINFSVPSEFNEGYAPDNAGTININASRILEFKNGDSLTSCYSLINRENGGNANQRSYINRHTQVNTYIVDESISGIIFTEDWESSGFTENSWTVVNNSENIWVVGQAENNGGTSSAYVSNNGGSSANYNFNNAEVSHFYKDFTIPNDGSVTLSFDWKCQGENAGGLTQYDYGTVVITTTGTTPVAGTEVTTTQTDGAVTTRLGAQTNGGKFNLNYGTTPGTTWNTENIDLSNYLGETKRIVFTWKNDGSAGSNPPFIIDNIIITYNLY